MTSEEHAPPLPYAGPRLCLFRACVNLHLTVIFLIRCRPSRYSIIPRLPFTESRRYHPQLMTIMMHHVSPLAVYREYGRQPSLEARGGDWGRRFSQLGYPRMEGKPTDHQSLGTPLNILCRNTFRKSCGNLFGQAIYQHRSLRAFLQIHHDKDAHRYATSGGSTCPRSRGWAHRNGDGLPARETGHSNGSRGAQSANDKMAQDGYHQSTINGAAPASGACRWATRERFLLSKPG